MAPAVAEDQNEFDEPQSMGRVESLAREVFVRMLMARPSTQTNGVARMSIEAAKDFYKVFCDEPEEPTDVELAESKEPEPATA